MNKAIFIGNLTRDPQLREFGQSSVCSFDVAVSMRKDRPPIYISVSVWNDPLRSNCSKYLKKGSKVCVYGELDYPYAYKTEQGEAKATIKVKATEVEFLPNPNAKQGGQQEQLPQSIPGMSANNYGYQAQHGKQEQRPPWEAPSGNSTPAGFSELDPNEPAPWESPY